MQVFIRVDGSTSIGTGHVMRCVLLAEMLVKVGAIVSFLMRAEQGHLCDWVADKGFHVFQMREGLFTQSEDEEEVIEILKEQDSVDWLIVDHYGLDAHWEKKIRSYAQHIAVIDDLANRKHDCNLLLDQNYVPNLEQRYDSLVPTSCRLLLGPPYILLRPEFLHERKNIRTRKGDIKRILVFYGGSDPTNETMKVLKAFEVSEASGIKVDVVVGNANPFRAEIKETCTRLGYEYHCQIDYLSSLMSAADFSLGAGGVTMWERCFLGLPTAVTIVADNQRETTEATAQFGAIWNVGFHQKVQVQDYRDVLHKALISSVDLEMMSENALSLLGKSVNTGVHPVVQTILEG
ncbi:UDP-2,4-diacetamido-2,4,6-trideoxy-beta-L-altropyranose hydrolase [Paenibacillus qinlingensis]|uniref:UDP-2,4-diacetamido-2,4, 6-trideoxy-beta-L-altropyranose hydrolase n=1 Tax=Paenibacillus qinlingensis TaxID=1837343 RepID=A0ABU1P1F6_9BACL|nr:UDP-2,4-diacetamido-2,4,6-trideoxy-beta-L-altropyranose hydrolase [Paenibacillus qinlingensis]MDR6553578.1 UDP-2,4-diacetamido-2,4,6-trideoxy-beta-L-altropyranose hydrolase [Paenibacillus qinlingensis]